MTFKENMALGLFAAWRSVFGDTTAVKFIEASGRGVLRSFGALLFALPLFFMTAWLQFRGAGAEWFGVFHYAGIFAGYAISWVVFAVFAFYAYETNGPRQNYLAFMPLYNWARVYALVMLLPYFAAESFLVLDGWVKPALWATSAAAVLVYKLNIIRKTLQLHFALAVLLLAADVVIFLAIEFSILKLYRVLQ